MPDKSQDTYALLDELGRILTRLAEARQNGFTFLMDDIIRAKDIVNRLKGRITDAR